ncbi:hypothetical protein KAU08_04830, partial [bacterium]|nr:hypothetical protein [bacterium]
MNLKLPLDLYAWVLILFLLLMLIPQRPWFIEMFCHFLHLALLPAILIFVVMLVKRKWRRAALWAVPSIAFIFLFGGLFLPSLEKHDCTWRSTATCTHLRVMTIN